MGRWLSPPSLTGLGLKMPWTVFFQFFCPQFLQFFVHNHEKHINVSLVWCGTMSSFTICFAAVIHLLWWNIYIKYICVTIANVCEHIDVTLGLIWRHQKWMWFFSWCMLACHSKCRLEQHTKWAKKNVWFDVWLWEVCGSWHQHHIATANVIGQISSDSATVSLSVLHIWHLTNQIKAQ